MAISRREFVVKSALAGAAVAAAGVMTSRSQAAEGAGEAKLLLSSQDHLIPGKNLEEVVLELTGGLEEERLQKFFESFK